MKKNIILIFISIIIVYLIILSCVDGKTAKSYDIKSYGKTIILNEEESIDIEKFIPLVVMDTLPVDSEEELLKMQLVITRTFIVYRMKDAKEITAEELGLSYVSYAELESKWGTKFIDKYNKLQKLVYNTNLEIITYKDNPIVPFFHNLSAGKTRNGSEVYGEGYEYLSSVESEADLTAKNYLKIDYFSKSELVKKIKEYDQDVDISEDNIFEKLEIYKKCSEGYVILVKIDNAIIDAEAFTKLFNISSTHFEIEEYEGEVRILAHGIGNGFGVSINGASMMASCGKSYKEILEYYYKNVSIG